MSQKTFVFSLKHPTRFVMTQASTHLGYVVSDLHVFSCASRYERFMPELRKAAETHSLLVLNGDTFDFKRSRFASAQETIANAILWLSELCSHAPQTQIKYLLGNHDSNPPFVDALSEFAQSVPNISVIPTIHQIGANLFLHGDACDLPEGLSDVTSIRERYASADPSVASIVCAKLVTHLRLNMIEYIRHSKRELAATILRYLEHNHPEYSDSVRAIYFGHTHVPFQNFEYRGLIFNNTGSLIRGLRSQPMEFTI